MILIREIEFDDINRGFLNVLENLISTDLDSNQAINILKEIKLNPLQKIFVALDDTNDAVVGTTTLLIEQKFINKGMKVGYIEDVSVKKGFERLGIGKQIVGYAIDYARSVPRCNKVFLYCSEKTMYFYKRMGFKLVADTNVMSLEF